MSPNNKQEPGRRDFARWAVWAAAASAALPLTASAEADDKAPDKPTMAKTIEALVRLRFGQFLTEDQIQRVTARIEAQPNTATALKRVPLKNSDEPAFLFQAE